MYLLIRDTYRTTKLHEVVNFPTAKVGIEFEASMHPGLFPGIDSDYRENNRAIRIALSSSGDVAVFMRSTRGRL